MPLKYADVEPQVKKITSQRPSEWSVIDVLLHELGQFKRVVAGMGFDTSDAEDILQDVSVAALKKERQCDNLETAKKWLMKVTVNRCLLEHRRRKTFKRKASVILLRRSQTKTEPMTPDAHAIRSEKLETVRTALKDLDGSLLCVMVLRYYSGLNSAQVAEVLDLNASTVRSRLKKARMIMARQLTNEGIE